MFFLKGYVQKQIADAIDGLFDLIKKLFMYLCAEIYDLIPKFYNIFYDLAGMRYLSSEMIQDFSANLYVLVSVVMLFAFAANILAAIANPDLMNDKQKGIGALFKRSMIGICLIILVPFIFDEAYKIQGQIMDNGVIEKVITGMNIEEGENNGGQVIAGTLAISLIYPVEEDVPVPEAAANSYKAMIEDDIGEMTTFAKYVNTEYTPTNSTTPAYAFKVHYLVLPIAGIATVYMLLLFCIDTATRIFKLAFIELSVPIVVLGYIWGGDDILKKWVKQTVSTFLDVFLRIAAMALYLFFLSHLDEFMQPLGDANFVLKVFLVIGLLMFAKGIPEFINGLFGTNITAKGGIAGRLGQMAGVGEVAKRGWEKIRNPIAAATGIGSAVGGTISHLGAGISRSIRNGRDRAEELRAAGRRGAGVRGFVRGVGGTVGSVLGTPGATIRSLRSGVNNRNLSGIGAEIQRDRDTHPEESTAGGRIVERARSFVGLPSGGDSIDIQIQFNNDLQAKREAIREAANHSVTRAGASIGIRTYQRDNNGNLVRDNNGNLISTDGVLDGEGHTYVGSYEQIKQRLDAERAAAANIQDATARTREFNRLDMLATNLDQSRRDTRDILVDRAMNNDNTGLAEEDFNKIVVATREIGDMVSDRSKISAREVADRNLNLTGNALLDSINTYTTENLVTGRPRRDENDQIVRDANGNVIYETQTLTERKRAATRNRDAVNASRGNNSGGNNSNNS